MKVTESDTDRCTPPWSVLKPKFAAEAEEQWQLCRNTNPQDRTYSSDTKLILALSWSDKELQTVRDSLIPFAKRKLGGRSAKLVIVSTGLHPEIADA